ncbi:MAG: TolC family protein [Chthoniobacterales bacterium]
MKTFKVTLLLCLGVGLGSARAEVLSQEEVLRTALRANPTVKAARARWEMMKERVPQARAWEDPMVGVDVERHGTTRFDRYTDTESMVSQSIPLSGKNLSRGRTAVAEARATYEEYRRVELDVVTRAKIAYSKSANAYTQLEINERNVGLLQQFADISRVKYEAGTQTQSEVLIAQTDLLRLSETRTNLERDLSDQQSMLNVLMNRPANSPMGRPRELTFRRRDFTFAELQAKALAQRPEVTSAQEKIEAERARVQLARREWFPDPRIRVEARQFEESSRTFNEYDTGVFFSVPWGNFGKYSAGVREAKKSLENAENQAEAVRAETAGLIRDQLRKIETAARNYELFRGKIIPLAVQATAATRAGYESDKSGFLELITAQRTFREVEANAANYLADYEIAVAELESIIGHSPSPPSPAEKGSSK